MARTLTRPVRHMLLQALLLTPFLAHPFLCADHPSPVTPEIQAPLCTFFASHERSPHLFHDISSSSLGCRPDAARCADDGQRSCMAHTNEPYRTSFSSSSSSGSTLNHMYTNSTMHTTRVTLTDWFVSWHNSPRVGCANSTADTNSPLHVRVLLSLQPITGTTRHTTSAQGHRTVHADTPSPVEDHARPLWALCSIPLTRPSIDHTASALFDASVELPAPSLAVVDVRYCPRAQHIVLLYGWGGGAAMGDTTAAHLSPTRNTMHMCTHTAAEAADKSSSHYALALSDTRVAHQALTQGADVRETVVAATVAQGAHKLHVMRERWLWTGRAWRRVQHDYILRAALTVPAVAEPFIFTEKASLNSTAAVRHSAERYVLHSTRVHFAHVRASAEREHRSVALLVLLTPQHRRLRLVLFAATAHDSAVQGETCEGAHGRYEMHKVAEPNAIARSSSSSSSFSNARLLPDEASEELVRSWQVSGEGGEMLSLSDADELGLHYSCFDARGGVGVVMTRRVAAHGRSGQGPTLPQDLDLHVFALSPRHEGSEEEDEKEEENGDDTFAAAASDYHSYAAHDDLNGYNEYDAYDYYKLPRDDYNDPHDNHMYDRNMDDHANDRDDDDGDNDADPVDLSTVSEARLLRSISWSTLHRLSTCSTKPHRREEKKTTVHSASCQDGAPSSRSVHRDTPEPHRAHTDTVNRASSIHQETNSSYTQLHRPLVASCTVHREKYKWPGTGKASSIMHTHTHTYAVVVTLQMHHICTNHSANSPHCASSHSACCPRARYRIRLTPPPSSAQSHAWCAESACHVGADIDGDALLHARQSARLSSVYTAAHSRSKPPRAVGRWCVQSVTPLPCATWGRMCEAMPKTSWWRRIWKSTAMPLSSSSSSSSAWLCGEDSNRPGCHDDTRTWHVQAHTASNATPLYVQAKTPHMRYDCVPYTAWHLWSLWMYYYLHYYIKHTDAICMGNVDDCNISSATINHNDSYTRMSAASREAINWAGHVLTRLTRRVRLLHQCSCRWAAVHEPPACFTYIISSMNESNCSETGRGWLSAPQPWLSRGCRERTTAWWRFSSSSSSVSGTVWGTAVLSAGCRHLGVTVYELMFVCAVMAGGVTLAWWARSFYARKSVPNRPREWRQQGCNGRRSHRYT